MDDPNAHATKADLAELEARLEARIVEVEARIVDRLTETIRDTQTELLKAFYNYAQTSDERIASTEAETASVKKRLAILESRIKEVEKRLNMPPAA